MTGVVVVLRHVLVRGLVTAERGAAGLTGPEMDPVGTYLDTLLADIFFGLFQLRDGLHM